MQQAKLATAKWILGDDLGYLREKLGNILLDLHHLSRIQQDENLESRLQRQELASALSGAVSDTVALLAAAAGEHISGNDLQHYARQIIAEGREGYESVAYSLGIIEETTKQRAWRELKTLLARIEAALALSRRDGRTPIHVLLAPYESDRRSLIQSLIALTDSVTLNEIEWSQYQVDAKRLIQRIREKYQPTTF